MLIKPKPKKFYSYAPVWGKAAAGGASLALDGTPQAANSGSASSLALPAFSTSFAGEVFVAMIGNGGPSTAPTGAGLTFTKRATTNDGNAFNVTDLWAAPSAGAISSQVITAHMTTADFFTAVVFAFSGVKTSAPFDTNGAIPGTSNTNVTPATWTTSNATGGVSDILIVANRTGGTVTAGAGFTLITGVNFLGVEYQSIASNASATAFSWATGTSGNGSICDAIVQGP